MKKINNNGKMIGALMAGVAIGGALGILFAPDKGSSTRNNLVSKGEALKEDAKEKYESLLSELKKDLKIA
jgi:gas vesicle protein